MEKLTENESSCHANEHDDTVTNVIDCLMKNCAHVET